MKKVAAVKKRSYSKSGIRIERDLCIELYVDGLFVDSTIRHGAGQVHSIPASDFLTTK